MSFDEWLEDQQTEYGIENWAWKLDTGYNAGLINLFKLVQAYRKYRYYQRDSELNEAVEEIAVLEAALMRQID